MLFFFNVNSFLFSEQLQWNIVFYPEHTGSMKYFLFYQKLFVFSVIKFCGTQGDAATDTNTATRVFLCGLLPDRTQTTGSVQSVGQRATTSETRNWKKKWEILGLNVT